MISSLYIHIGHSVDSCKLTFLLYRLEVKHDLLTLDRIRDLCRDEGDLFGQLQSYMRFQQ